MCLSQNENKVFMQSCSAENTSSEGDCQHDEIFQIVLGFACLCILLLERLQSAAVLSVYLAGMVPEICGHNTIFVLLMSRAEGWIGAGRHSGPDSQGGCGVEGRPPRHGPSCQVQPWRCPGNNKSFPCLSQPRRLFACAR